MCIPYLKKAITRYLILTFRVSLPLLTFQFCHAFHGALFRLPFLLSCLSSLLLGNLLPYYVTFVLCMLTFTEL